MKPTAYLVKRLARAGDRRGCAGEGLCARNYGLLGAAARRIEKEPLPADFAASRSGDRRPLPPHASLCQRRAYHAALDRSNKGMAGRCVQGLIDVLEANHGGDLTKMPYVVNKEAFRKS